MRPGPQAPARGPATGAVCGLGAVLAHAAAGGDVAPGAALLVLLASVGLGAQLLRGPVDALQTFALALVAQVACHVGFALTGADGGSHSPAAMLLTHLVAAALTTVVALGVERELVLAACRRVRLQLPAPAPLVARPHAGAPYAALATSLPPAAPLRGAHALRAPPR